MAIKSELRNDATRGPGYGLVRITGLPAGTVHVRYCLERNQGSLPYLGVNGQWQGQEVWHEIDLDGATPEGQTADFSVGPEVVDPIVEQPQHVMCRLTVDSGAETHTAALRIQRPLLSSKAHAVPTPPEPMPAAVPEPESVPDRDLPPEDAVPGVAAVPEPLPGPDPIHLGNERTRWRLAAWLALPSVALAVAAWLWWDCRIPALPGPNCSSSRTDSAPPADTLPRNCAGLTAEACLAAATQALQAGNLDRARQLLQEAGNLGAVNAYIRLARMYDPATWAADKSPAGQADWETAAYWYEEAARAGDREGMLGAGRLYCGNSADAAFRTHGADLLRKAAAAVPDDAAAAQALKECEEKLK